MQFLLILWDEILRVLAHSQIRLRFYIFRNIAAIFTKNCNEMQLLTLTEFGNDAIQFFFAFLPLADETLAGKREPFWKDFSLLPTALYPRGIELMGWFSGPGCSSVLWLISGDPDRYAGSASDQSSSICGQLLAEVLANQSSIGSPWHHRFCPSAVFSLVTKRKKNRVKGTLLFFISFFNLKLLLLVCLSVCIFLIYMYFCSFISIY